MALRHAARRNRLAGFNICAHDIGKDLLVAPLQGRRAHIELPTIVRESAQVSQKNFKREKGERQLRPHSRADGKDTPDPGKMTVKKKSRAQALRSRPATIRRSDS